MRDREERNNQMNGCERVKLAIAHKQADRVPRFDQFWRETLTKYRMTQDQLAEKFDFDIVIIPMDNSMRFPTAYRDMGEFEEFDDRCGYTIRRRKAHSSSHYVKHVNKDYDNWLTMRDRFRLDKNDESRVSLKPYYLCYTPHPSWEDAVSEINAAYPGKYKLLQCYGPYEGTWRHHGMENTLMNLYAEPEYMDEMFEGITRVTIETLDYAMEMKLDVDGIWLIEDMGSTRSSLFSPQTYRERLKPFHKRISETSKKYGLSLFIHSCGEITNLLPDIIDAGFDVVQPLQADTTMNVVDLKARFGDKVTFFGNIDCRKMAQGQDAIKAELLTKLIPAMKDGGYIYHSDHSIPPEVSYENYCYLMELLDKYGRY
jgi:uroporphyrinogen decarboxylase